jgi:hypothetical protein
MRSLLLGIALCVLIAFAAATARGYGINDTAVPGAAVSSPYAYQLQTSGGSPPHSFRISSGDLPPGIALTSEGLLTGTPIAPGSYAFYVEAKDAWNPPMFSQRLIEMIVLPKLPPAEVGKLFATMLRYKDQPLRWEIASGSLPAGLDLDSRIATIRGTPTASGSYPLTIAAPDADGRMVLLQITVRIAPRLAISSTSLRAGTHGRPYTASFASVGGVRPVEWRITRGRLPIGLRLNTSTARLSGRPQTTGRFPLTVTATDALRVASSKAFTLTVSRQRR